MKLVFAFLYIQYYLPLILFPIFHHHYQQLHFPQAILFNLLFFLILITLPSILKQAIIVIFIKQVLFQYYLQHQFLIALIIFQLLILAYINILFYILFLLQLFILLVIRVNQTFLLVIFIFSFHFFIHFSYMQHPLVFILILFPHQINLHIFP